MSNHSAAEAAFDALGDPMRRRILECLNSASPAGRRTRRANCPIGRPAVSKHLRVLENAGLVEHSSRGTRNLYALAPDGLRDVQSWLIGLWDTSLTSFAEFVASTDGAAPDDDANTNANTAPTPTPTPNRGPNNDGRAHPPRDPGRRLGRPGLRAVHRADRRLVAAGEIQRLRRRHGRVRGHQRLGRSIVERSGDRVSVWAEVTEWDPPGALGFTWHPGTDPAKATRVRVTFSAEGDQTLVTVQHSGWEILADPALAAAAAQEYGQGWPGVLGGFASWSPAAIESSR